MRSIQVSDPVYAAVWSKWQDGDPNEDAILRRVLGVAKSSETRPSDHYINSSDVIGYRDQRYGVEFRRGFEVFRTFKGRHYRAIAQNGGWTSEDNQFFRSLNQLSAQIGAPTENAWMGWNYQDGDRVRPISDLRDPSKVRRRTS